MAEGNNNNNTNSRRNENLEWIDKGAQAGADTLKQFIRNVSNPAYWIFGGVVFVFVYWIILLVSSFIGGFFGWKPSNQFTNNAINTGSNASSFLRKAPQSVDVNYKDGELRMKFKNIDTNNSNDTVTFDDLNNAPPEIGTDNNRSIEINDTE